MFKNKLKDKGKLTIILVALLMFAAGLIDGLAMHNITASSSLFQEKTSPGGDQTPAGDLETSAAPWPETVTLVTRKFVPSMDEEGYDTERDSGYTYSELELNLDETALLIMDAWQSAPNDGWTERAHENMRLKLKPLIDLARYHNIPVIHLPNGGEIYDLCKPLPGEFVLDSENDVSDLLELQQYLEARHIRTLIYAGYTSNWCLLNRPTGILNMRFLNYKIILVRDCTIAFELPETLDSEAANLVMINLVENQFGPSTTLDDLKTALR